MNLKTNPSMAFLILASYELDVIDRTEWNDRCFSKLFLSGCCRLVKLNEKRVVSKGELLLRVLKMFFEEVKKGVFLAKYNKRKYE
jgi:hypothetical protein